MAFPRDVLKEEPPVMEEQTKLSDKLLTALQTELKEQAGLIGKLTAQTIEMSREIAKFFWSIFIELFDPILDQLIVSLNHSFLEITQEGFNKSVDKLGEAFNLDTRSIESLKGFYQVIEGSGTIPSAIIIALSFIQLLSIFNQANTGKIQQAIHADKRPFPADPGSTMRAAFLDSKLSERVWDLCRRNGLEDKDIELMFAAMYTLQDPNLIREIYFRHDPGEKWAENRLFEHGMTPDRIKETMSVWPMIPSIQDLIMMMGKEAFEPDMIAKFGLSAEYPEELDKWAKTKGLSPEWANRYWIAHWQHPGLSNVLDMFHRGILDWDSIYEYMRVVEIPPYWRDKIRDVAYNVLTRVDVRRIHKMGVIDDERLIKSYMDQGYSQENAEIMASFTIQYNESDQRTLTKNDILKAYEDRDLEFNQALVMLVEVGYREAAAGFYLSRVDLEMERAVRLERIGLIKDKFLANLVSEAGARNELMAHGVMQKRINELLDRWKVIVIKNAKLPSKTDVDKMLKHKIINENEYRKQMFILGYKAEYIEWFYQLASIS